MNQPIQRRITLIRHAKAEDDGAAQDHLRRLNPRGLKDAAELGEWLKATQALPELILCSTALRTRETLEAFEANIPTILSEKAYLATTGELMALLQGVDDQVRHVGLIAHNPGLHQLAATLAGEYSNKSDEERLMLKFPTSACAILSAPLGSWKDVAPHSMRLEAFR